jgi:hypothetical protein
MKKVKSTTWWENKYTLHPCDHPPHPAILKYCLQSTCLSYSKSRTTRWLLCLGIFVLELRDNMEGKAAFTSITRFNKSSTWILKVHIYVLSHIYLLKCLGYLQWFKPVMLICICKYVCLHKMKKKMNKSMPSHLSAKLQPKFSINKVNAQTPPRAVPGLPPAEFRAPAAWASSELFEIRCLSYTIYLHEEKVLFWYG